MRNRARLIAVLCVVAAVAAPSAFAADRMWMGFHDDPTLRWGDQRVGELDRASADGATVVRTLVTWANVAPERPRRATDPFDPAYRLDDVDEIVRAAQAHGQEVLITIWGTPRWANGGKGPAFLPKKWGDFQNFARALASRYSGRYPGYPFVRFWGIWNESNLGSFLSPQFNAQGKIVGPALYAKLAAAGYAGIKSGSKKALVAIGETSSHGLDKKRAGVTDSVRPGTFARLVAAANKRLKFDAWAHHPYPYPVRMKATQRVLWPNVALTSLPRFETSLDQWFGRKQIPVWVTEYGHETRPGEPSGVTEGQQALYLSQAIAMLKKDQRVPLFVWFVYRDSDGSLWQSGLYRQSGTAKPAAARFRAAAPPLDMRNSTITVKGGTRNPLVTAYVREFCANNATGTPVGVTYRASIGGKAVTVGQAQPPLAIDCTVAFRIVGLTVPKQQTATVTLDLNTANGNGAARTLSVVGR
ncbi:MAG TPA: cellulase family glycosylhydrolase [Vicinamibacterales bacterium]|nr:cellulase family glycosylhydrolase [Vicinamibacterales bacterium]